MNAHGIYRCISPFFRRRRMRAFKETMRPRPTDRLLDIGGSPAFWEDSALRMAEITLLNPDPVLRNHCAEGMVIVDGDGCALAYADGSFDIVFSNSVIEHVGTWERQQAFAAEARRAGRRLWIQTPAREFFVEPHLLAPFIHWLPKGAQRVLVRNFTPRGWIDRPSRRAVDAFLDEVRLVSHAEMKELFPDCAILRERFLGMTKSYIAVR